MLKIRMFYIHIIQQFDKKMEQIETNRSYVDHDATTEGFC